MFKALVLTQKLIKHAQSTVNRQIISEVKEQVEYSPDKSPSKLQSSPSKVLQFSSKLQQSPSSSTSKSNHQQLLKPTQFLIETQTPFQQSFKNYPFKFTQLQGSLKIFHQYQLERIQDNFNQLINQNKKNSIATLAHLKTNILAILNITSKQDQESILSKLTQVKEQIDAVDLFVSKVNHPQITPHKNDKQSESSSKSPLLSSKQSQILSQQQTINIVVYFHTSIMSEEFYKLCYNSFTLLPVYLKQVIILQRQSSQEISYKQVLSSFKYIEPLHQQQNKLSLNQKDINWLQNQQRNWIQLPQCVHCLLKLQFEVTGIDEKVLYLIASSQTENQSKHHNKTLPKCSTCRILAQNRKQNQLHRKLSTSSDHKDHSKSNQTDTHCDDCKQKSDIWICMVCSRVGCGRYKNADAYKHFVKSGHIITIDLETERVWNYMSDCFSHKLLKNINETTNVKFPQISKDQSEKIEQSKLQGAFWQYCSVFSEEMQRQRTFYENIKLSEEEKFKQQNDKLDTIIKELQREREQKSIQVKRTLKKKGKVTKKHKQLEDKVAQQREILKEQDECLGADWLKNSLDNDEDVKRKIKELQQLERQLNQVLAQLSSN